MLLCTSTPVRKVSTEYTLLPTESWFVPNNFGCSQSHSIKSAHVAHDGKIHVLQNEVMTGTYTQNPMVSRITLALMEDTGFVPQQVALILVLHSLRVLMLLCPILLSLDSEDVCLLSSRSQALSCFFVAVGTA